MIDLPESDLRSRLAAALSVARWVDDVAASAPFASVDELVSVAHNAATPLSPAEIDEAIAHHPRIGEKAAGTGAAQSFSAREQASSDSDDEAVAAGLAAGNADYEKRFGRVFLIRAAGRTRGEILAELRRRMTLDEGSEMVIVGEQLRDIAVLRLRSLFGDEPVAGQSATPEQEGQRQMSQITTHVLDSALGRPAAGVPVQLETERGDILDIGVTDADGRISEIGPLELEPRVYRLVFDVGTYFAATGQTGFYPRIVIDFDLADSRQHYHVPVLLSPYAYSTYRGS